ncbi:MAG: Gfo/Idh/MocA family oxidoreductase [Lachnospiraceae bacterium]|nr:Gfo/Idh/MocA family oxidoreductase [Lachnospiraceae bacterium]
MINFKVGIIGAGSIAATVADTLTKLDAFEPYAIASRDLNKAKDFAEAHGCAKAYGSYDELVQDPDVELVYIATPHAFHAEQAKMCINAGKPCLVEKAFSYNAVTAKEVLDLAEEKKIFCGEAMWIRFNPLYKLAAKIIFDNKIGKLNHIQATLGYDIKEKERIQKPELAGGALLDLGIYCLNLSAMFFGKDPANVLTTCRKFNTGVDAQEVISFAYEGGRTADYYVTAMYKAENNARFYCDLGYIEIENMNNPERLRVFGKSKELIFEATVPDAQISGYEYEFFSARDAIITGKTECVEITHRETIRLLQHADTLRATWKMLYPMEAATDEKPA